MTVDTCFLWKSVEFLKNLRCKDCIDPTRTVHNIITIITCIYHEEYNCFTVCANLRPEAWFKRRISPVPNLTLMSKIYCSCSLALDLAHVKFDV